MHRALSGSADTLHWRVGLPRECRRCSGVPGDLLGRSGEGGFKDTVRYVVLKTLRYIFTL